MTNKINIAVERRNDITAIIHKVFLEHVEGEDNSWRCKHNVIILELGFERLLFEYLEKMK